MTDDGDDGPMTAAGRADSSDVPDKAGRPGVRRRRGQTTHDSEDGGMTVKTDGRQMTAKTGGTTEGRWTHDSDNERVTRQAPAPVPLTVPTVLLAGVGGAEGGQGGASFLKFCCDKTPLCFGIFPFF